MTTHDYSSSRQAIFRRCLTISSCALTPQTRCRRCRQLDRWLGFGAASVTVQPKLHLFCSAPWPSCSFSFSSSHRRFINSGMPHWHLWGSDRALKSAWSCDVEAWGLKESSTCSNLTSSLSSFSHRVMCKLRFISRFVQTTWTGSYLTKSRDGTVSFLVLAWTLSSTLSVSLPLF